MKKELEKNIIVVKNTTIRIKNQNRGKIGKIKAQGGGDLPEDWAGAYKKLNEEIKWRNGTKVIFHLADAGAHGKCHPQRRREG